MEQSHRSTSSATIATDHYREGLHIKEGEGERRRGNEIINRRGRSCRYCDSGEEASRSLLPPNAIAVVAVVAPSIILTITSYQGQDGPKFGFHGSFRTSIGYRLELTSIIFYGTHLHMEVDSMIPNKPKSKFHPQFHFHPFTPMVLNVALVFLMEFILIELALVGFHMEFNSMITSLYQTCNQHGIQFQFHASNSIVPDGAI